MRRIGIAAVLALVAHAPAAADVEVEGRRMEVIYVHLHPSSFGRMAPNGRSFIVQSMPPFARLYALALVNRLLDPWAPHVGIRAQADWAGVDRVVLLAVYVPRTTGYFDSASLGGLLDDPRNVTAGGNPWAYGMPSLDFEDWSPDERLAALESWPEARPEAMVGIKLAHAHQGVTFDDEAYLRVYDVAAQHGVPVLLHTGFSPFPDSRTEPEYYDPLGLEAIVEAYDGEHGMGRVDFVLSHVGQGDARAMAHALSMAERHDNVWLEISALDRPLQIDEDGAPVTRSEPQYPFVLEQLRARGLTDRAIFASDGPQFSGMIRRYLGRIVEGMRDTGWDLDQMEAVLGGNARRLFLTR